MNSVLKKTISILLCLMMVFSIMPSLVFAEEGTSFGEEELTEISPESSEKLTEEANIEVSEEESFEKSLSPESADGTLPTGNSEEKEIIGDDASNEKTEEVCLQTEILSEEASLNAVAEPANAKAVTYDAAAAVAFANQYLYINEGTWDCSTYVGNCMKAGGIPSIIGNNSIISVNMLVDRVNATGVFERKQVYNAGGNHVKAAGYIKPGDIIVYYCKGCGCYSHAAIVVAIDRDDNILYNQHHPTLPQDPHPAGH